MVAHRNLINKKQTRTKMTVFDGDFLEKEIAANFKLYIYIYISLTADTIFWSDVCPYTCGIKPDE